MIKAVHYFSSGWAANFWGTFPPKNVSAELRQIKEDGFNTIILLVPWRGFQPRVEEPVYNEVYINRLEIIMAEASEQGIKVLLRVSYPHYFCPVSEGAPLLRVERVIRDQSIRQSWLCFISHIGNVVSNYQSFLYAFISWEDFWHVFTAFQKREYDLRLKISKNIAYTEFLIEAVGLEIYNSKRLAQEAIYANGEDIEIPTNESPRNKFYLDFINFKIDEILNSARDYISPLIMEVRIDKDRHIDKFGDQHWHTNDLQMFSQLPRLTYWAPFVGAENKGEKLSANRGLELFEHFLCSTTNNGDNPRHIINQFNFIDETPAFKGIHAEIAGDQLPLFMEKACKLIKQYSHGYGLWAYRDYQQNIILNSEFSQHDLGWECASGKFLFIEHASKPQLLLKDGISVKQTFQFFDRGVGNNWLINSKKLYFSVEIGDLPWHQKLFSSSLELRFANSCPAEIRKTRREYSGYFDVSNIFDPRASFSFEIKGNRGQTVITRVSLYFYEFKNHIYDNLGMPGKHRNMIVAFNKSLD